MFSMAEEKTFLSTDQIMKIHIAIVPEGEDKQSDSVYSVYIIYECDVCGKSTFKRIISLSRLPFTEHA